MRVVINARTTHYLDRGLGTYSRNLIEALGRVAPEHQYVFIVERDRKLPEIAWPPQSKFWYTRGGYGSYLYRDVFEQIVLPLGLWRLRADIYHQLDWTLPLGWVPCPMVTAFHDTIPLTDLDKRPSLSSRRVVFLIKAASRRADRIITISNYSKNEIVRELGIAENKVTVVYLGVRDPFGEVAASDVDLSALRDLGISGEYIFYIGGFQHRKNVATLLRAFRQVLDTYPAIKLVLGGSQSSDSSSVASLANQLGIADSVVFTGTLSVEQVASLMRRATIFVLPSLHEGFGLPVLEAMACGTPVICSNVTALPEVAGDAVRSIDPLDVSGFASAMRQLLADPEARSSLAEAGRRRAAMFSWDETARRTREVYEELKGCGKQ
jgi:glycosyltransferase involved in cell wall biosynthesis